MYSKRIGNWLKHLDFFLIDFICLEAAYFLALWLRYQGSEMSSQKMYFGITGLILFIQGFVVLFSESYKNIIKRGMLKELKEAFIHATYVNACILIWLYMSREIDSYSRMVFFLTWIFSFLFCWIARSLWKKNLLKHQELNTGKRKAIIITLADIADRVVEQTKKNCQPDVRLDGVVLYGQKDVPGTIQGLPVIANEENFAEVIKNQWIDEALVVMEYEGEEAKNVLTICAKMGITTHFSWDLPKEEFGKQVIDKFCGYTTISNCVNAISGRQLFLKRVMEIIGGFVGCVITGILTIIIGPIIYIKSPGPIFFSQERVGRNGKTFKMYKFRSMVMNAEELKKELMEKNKIKDGMMFKIDNDPRIIKGIGNFIRKTSLDEFPQFFNVLKGDMSLIGTRPPTLDEWEKYDLHHRKRMAIKPGITGMWQISGRSDITDFETVVKMDVDYITSWSLGLDIKILFKTVVGVFTGNGAC